MALTGQQILQADDLKKEAVEVPEWGGTVWVRTMTGTERDAFLAVVLPDKGSVEANLKNALARLVVRCAINETGERLFSDDDAEALAGKSHIALDRVAIVAQRLNGMRKEDVADLGKS